MRNYALFFIIITLSGCRGSLQKIETISLSTLEDESTSIQDFENYKATVITFFSPECPLSENYTRTINEIHLEFSIQNIRFINIFPGEYYSVEKINSFIALYNVKQTNLLDKQLLLTRRLRATITPETFVMNEKGNKVYSGAIDNWAVDLGSKRQVITEFYLKDVLTAIINSEEVKVDNTNAVGCYIELKK